jgi:hypothetical protein
MINVAVSTAAHKQRPRTEIVQRMCIYLNYVTLSRHDGPNSIKCILASIPVFVVMK